ncbi:tRNA (N6-threonylcarbamoyladenosine(37)-N6)-methyltransferase TrmO [Thalassolituus sp. UBA3500]|uniref:tRNA (N6-threonylcarbamoyladenosine(37)-N6)-methyltransferase TrmO n=1 Tax=Thalassolituus sp. UBA3500 TaxID=1947664 RepID=UPI000C0F6873|nr:tRNA (N6-threonylcarbamoyladenosine(37)-N6)-methyltransferase TrmO [Thalassolituus sp. UBA3500]MBN57090.1 tRNA (N6-threonylcarbamoyladenosine(37)-N6)-methyltransferase TrmO [Oceanospirillaceae bacterium]|tara:strand:- start:3302 stop:3994 length:693 start_codon:yes stop_codon:yes gene_type:complete
MPTLDILALARSPYKEKFAIPRQPGLAPSVLTWIELQAPFDDPGALQGLERVSHIWLIFCFHGVGSRPESLRVRPPRLGGNQRIGVFATRSTHRPNGLGQSLVKIEKIEGTTLLVSGADLLDGTPIVDIKPYVPYTDSVPDATNAIAPSAPEPLTVSWSEEARRQATTEAARLNENVIAVIEECLAQDPRPAYQAHDPEREYGVRLWDLNIRWRYPSDQSIVITEVSPLA